MAWYHVGNCNCPVGCCDCGPDLVYTHAVEYWNEIYNKWCTMKFENRRSAADFVLENWEEIKRKRLVRKLGRKPKLINLAKRG